MPMSHESFVALLRMNYPDHCRRAEAGPPQPPGGFGGDSKWWDPRTYDDAEQRQAAAMSYLMDSRSWDDLQDHEKAELTTLVSKFEADSPVPVARLYNFVNELRSRTTLRDPVTGKVVSRRYSEMDWTPLVEDPAQTGPTRFIDRPPAGGPRQPRRHVEMGEASRPGPHQPRQSGFGSGVV